MVHYISNEVLLLEQLDTIINTKVKDTSLSEATEQHYTQLRHYACGIGERLPCKLVRIMLFLKIQSFSYGFSGVRLALVQRLIDFFNNGVYPVVYSKDIPDERFALAHLSLPLIG